VNQRPRHAQKLVFVNRYFDPDQSATSQMLTDLARGLVARGLAVHVVCSRQLYADAGAKLLRLEDCSGVVAHRVGTTRFGRARLLGRALDYASFYLSASITLAKILGAGDVLIAKTDPPLISVPAAIVARLKRAQLVNWQQDVFPEVATALGVNPLPQFLRPWLRWLRDLSLQSASMNVLIGHRMREYFRQRGICDSKLCVIENWADPELISGMATGSSVLRANLGITDQFVVCYSGNLGRAHEFDTLLGAARMLRADHSIIFLVVGGGAKMELLRNAVRELELENFRFLPYRDRHELGDSLAAADVHLASLLPALEGFILPSKLYGILAAARPLLFVGDSCGDIARTVQNAQCGLAMNVLSSAELAAAIRSLQRDPETCRRMGGRARELFLSHHTLDKAVDHWMTLIQRMRF
jgi:colanic acid biosynthesis glycosyl transferase WcaI